jgi:hypothetical protein
MLYIDTDNDSVVDANDAFPNAPTETLDTDNNGLGNNTDSDDDNDGLSNQQEGSLLGPGTEPLNPDTDGDGAIDTDISIQTPTTDIIVDLFPLNPNESSDSDGDCAGFNLIRLKKRFKPSPFRRVAFS